MNQNNPQQNPKPNSRNSPGETNVVNVLNTLGSLDADQQIRAYCIQAAATAIHGSNTSSRGDAVLQMAERFEAYIYAGSDAKPDA